MLPLLLASPSQSYGVITTRGRKTGKPRRRCVRLIRDEQRVYVVAIGGEGAAWVKNIRANPRVKLRVHGGSFNGVARDPRDESEAERLLAHFCDTIYPGDYVACALHRRGLPTRAKIEALLRRWIHVGTPLVVEIC